MQKRRWTRTEKILFAAPALSILAVFIAYIRKPALRVPQPVRIVPIFVIFNKTTLVPGGSLARGETSNIEDLLLSELHKHQDTMTFILKVEVRLCHGERWLLPYRSV